MKKQFQKDFRIRKLYKSQEFFYIILKSIIKNENLSFITKWNAMLKLFTFFSTQNKTKFVSRCVLTHRKAKLNRVFKKFSRLSFLRLVRSGNVTGLKKSSW